MVRHLASCVLSAGQDRVEIGDLIPAVIRCVCVVLQKNVGEDGVAWDHGCNTEGVVKPKKLGRPECREKRQENVKGKKNGVEQPQQQ